MGGTAGTAVALLLTHTALNRLISGFIYASYGLSLLLVVTAVPAVTYWGLVVSLVIPGRYGDHASEGVIHHARHAIVVVPTP